MSPRVSVVMSVYNGERYLREAVESVLAQTFDDFEFLIVDDGSTDSAPAILAEFAGRDPRVRVITQQNQGLTKSLNTALSQARGEYIARMDGDDACFPERFAKQVEYLENTPEVVAVGSATERIDAHGHSMGVRTMPTSHELIEPVLLEGSTCLAHPAVMIRRETVREIGGYAEQYRTSQDLDLFLRLAEVGALANIEEPLLRYRWHDDNVSVKKSDQQDRDVSAIIAAAYSGRGLPAPRGVPLARWQFRRVMARRYALNGQLASAVSFAWQAVGMRPCSLRSWYSLLFVLVRGSVARISR